MGNKSKVKFFTLTHGVTLSTAVANLEKSTKDKKTPQEISLATWCINFMFSYSSYYKRDLQNIHKKNKGLVKDQSPEPKVSKPQRIIMQRGGKKDMQ